MAAIAVGMFLGDWVLGPALTHSTDVAAERAVKSSPMSFSEMQAQPDPSPYRTPTPAFDMSNQPHYAEAARQKARAEAGVPSAGDPWSQVRDQPREQPVEPSAPRGRYPVPDRHAVY